MAIPKTTLLASSGSIEGIQKCIGRFYYSQPEGFGIVPFTAKLYRVFNKNGQIPGVIVVKKGNRFRFEMID